MKQTSEWMKERAEYDILFSRIVKAGKRVYYFDIKRDRCGTLYMSITESKRVKDGKATFEKHKIFLYREDMEKFMQAFTEAAGYAIQNSPMQNGVPSPDMDWNNDGSVDYYASAEKRPVRGRDGEEEDLSNFSCGKINIDLDF